MTALDDGADSRRVLEDTVRHIGDARVGTGIAHGDGMFESGGFIVDLFDRSLVKRLVAGSAIVELHEFDRRRAAAQVVAHQATDAVIRASIR